MIRVILFGIFLIYDLNLYALTINDLKSIKGTNPTPLELNEYIVSKCKEKNIPPIILKAILLQEGKPGQKWKQWDNNNVVVIGTDYTNNNKIKSYGLGLFQITFDVDINENFTNDSIHIKKVVSDWKYNIDIALSKLLYKWEKSSQNFTGDDGNSLIIENWYYPIAWYNGSGIDAKEYVDKIYNFMKNKSSVSSFLQSDSNKIEIEKQYKFRENISLPYVIPSFKITYIKTNPSQKNEIYYLKDIIDNGGKLFVWNKVKNDYFEHDLNGNNKILKCFNDIFDNIDYFEDICKIANKGYIKGYPNGNYEPDVKLKRAEVTKIILLEKYTKTEIESATKNIPYDKYFPDLINSQWYIMYVNFAKEKGVIKGYDDGTFRPANTITIAEVSSIIFKTFLSKKDGTAYISTGNKWFSIYKDELEKKGIDKKTNLEYHEPITRGYIAHIISKITDLGETE